MPKKVEWTVRVIQRMGPTASRMDKSNELRGVWVEQLRYMGHARELKHITDDGPERVVIEFYAPRGLDSQEWAKQNAQRMCSFGIDAAAAPKWENGTPLEP